MSQSHPEEVALLRMAGEGAVVVDQQTAAHVRECGRCAGLVRYARQAAEAIRREAPELDDEARQEVLAKVLETVGEMMPYRSSASE